MVILFTLVRQAKNTWPISDKKSEGIRYEYGRIEYLLDCCDRLI